MTLRHEFNLIMPCSIVSLRKQQTKVQTQVIVCLRVLPWSSHSLQEPPLVHLQAQVSFFSLTDNKIVFLNHIKGIFPR